MGQNYYGTSTQQFLQENRNTKSNHMSMYVQLSNNLFKAESVWPASLKAIRKTHPLAESLAADA